MKKEKPIAKKEEEKAVRSKKMITVTISNTTSGHSSRENQKSNENSNEDVKMPGDGNDGKYSIIFLSPDGQQEAEA